MRYGRYMYNKLFTKILDSSIWLEPIPTRIVWLTFIASMDEQGFCQFASVGNVSARARVTLKQAEQAIECLENPDPDSSDKDNEGRRIARMSGGWLVLNAEKYRKLVTRVVMQEQTRERVRRYRERQREDEAAEDAPVTEPLRESNASVTPSDTEREVQTEEGREKERAADAPPLSTGSVWDEWREEWNANPKRRTLPLNPVNGDIPKFAEVARRFPDDPLRRRLLHAYFTTDNRKILANPYSVGWFLHWADKLAELADEADDEARKEAEWLAK